MADLTEDSREHAGDAVAETRGDALASAMVLMLLLTVVQRGLGFIRNVLVCRFLEPADLGLWNLAQSFLVIAAPLIVLGVPGAFKRYVAYYQQRNQLRRFLRQATGATVLLTAGGIVLILAYRQQVSWLAFGDDQLSRLMVQVALTLGIVIAFNFCVELLTALRQVKVVSYLQLVNSLLFTVVSVVLLALDLKTAGVVYGYAIACVVTTVLSVAAIRSALAGTRAAVPPTESLDLWSKLLPFACWLWLSDLLTNLFGTVDRLMIVHFAEQSGRDAMAMIGQYHSSQIIGTLLIAMTGMLGGVLLSYQSHDWETGHRRRAEEMLDASLKQVALSLTVLAAVALLVAPGIFDWVLERRYAEGFQVLPMTMAYCIWFGLVGVAQNYLWCRERAWLVCVPLVIGLAANVLLNAWWLPTHGLLGVVMATAAANLATLGMVLGSCQLLGMQYQRSTLVAVLLPGALCGGGGVALAATLIYSLLGVTGGWLLTASQQQLWECQRDRWFRRLGWEHAGEYPSRTP